MFIICLLHHRKCNTTPDRCEYGAESHHRIEPGETVEQAIEKANEKHFSQSVGSGRKRDDKNSLVTESTGGSEVDDEVESDDNYDLPLAAFHKVENSIEKNNRRLERAGISERFTVSAEYYSTIKKRPDGYTYEDERVQFTLNRPQISYQGYHFLARVEEVSEGNYVAYTGPDSELKGWRPESMNCEYCNKKIARNKVYVIADENGNKKVVGGKCIELYTGMRPSNLWAMEYDVNDVLKDSDYQPGESGSSKRVESADDLLRVAYVISKDEGYKPTSFGLNSTVTKVDSVLHPQKNQPSGEALWGNKVLQESESVDIDSVKEEIREAIKDSDNDWSHNLRVFLQEDYVNTRGRGTVVSAMAALHKRREQKRQSKQWAKGFIGEAGEKVKDVQAKVIRAEEVEENYGYRPTLATKLTMQTSDGHRVFWKTSSAKVPREDDTIVFNATVKDTSTWRDVDSTRVIRAKWSAVEEDAESEGSDSDASSSAA